MKFFLTKRLYIGERAAFSRFLPPIPRVMLGRERDWDHGMSRQGGRSNSPPVKDGVPEGRGG